MDPSLIVPLAVLGLGCLLAFAVVGRREATVGGRVAVSLAWGPGLVAGILSLGSFFGLASGFGRLGWAGFLAILLAVMGSAVLAGGRERRPTPSRCLPRWIDRAGGAALVSLAAGYVWCFVRWLEDRPLGGYDAMGIWTYRALQWFRSGEGFPETVRLLAESKPDYPLLVPGVIASQFVLWGGESTAIPVATGWLFLIGLSAMTYVAVERFAEPGIALAAVATLLSTPMIWRSAFAQEADLALAYLVLGAAVGLFGAVAGNDSPAVPPGLTGFFLGLMVWTKNEGMVLAVVLFAVFAIASLRLRVRLPARWWGLAAAGVIPGVAATVFFKINWVTVSEIDRYLVPGIGSHLADPGRWGTIAMAVADRFAPWSAGAVWGGTWLVAVGLAVVGWVRRSSNPGHQGAVLFALSFLVALGCAAAVYLITPDPLDWHLRTSLDRLLMQLMPLLLVAVFVAALPRSGQGPALESG